MKKVLGVLCALGVFVSISSGHATELDTSPIHVEPPASTDPKPARRIPYGQQMAAFQHDQLIKEKAAMEKARAEHRLGAVRGKPGTEEGAHPFATGESPHIDF